ncbi:MAG: lactate utilization protein [Rhodoferax sp.]
MTGAREAILARLRAAPEGPSLSQPDVSAWYAAQPSKDATHDRVAQFCEVARQFRTEIHVVTSASWPQRVQQVMHEKGLHRLLIASRTPHGAALLAQPPQGVTLIDYAQPVEQCRDTLFDGVDAALTGSQGAIAETGSVIVWPTPQEPRLMSLVPPVHIVLVSAQQIYQDIFSAMKAQHWAKGMPTNLLLICGPSKTADIQQTLAYGAHGPRELVVLLIQPEGE